MRPSFIEFLELINPRFLQERELGLDVYLSGLWGWIPAGLAIVAATVFLLAIFHVIPSRRRSVPILLAVGVIAFVAGLIGTVVNHRALPLPEQGPMPAILSAERGRRPETDSHRATLLALPLLLGGVVATGAVVSATFVLIFGGAGRERESRRRDE